MTQLTGSQTIALFIIAFLSMIAGFAVTWLWFGIWRRKQREQLKREIREIIAEHEHHQAPAVSGRFKARY